MATRTSQKKRETKISLSTISSSRERVTFDSRRAYEERERERERERDVGGGGVVGVWLNDGRKTKRRRRL